MFIIKGKETIQELHNKSDVLIKYKKVNCKLETKLLYGEANNTCK